MTKHADSPRDTAGPRGDFGVVASVSRAPDGRVRLILDHVEAMPALGPEVHDFEHETFLNLKLKERELANIGLAIVARLASRGRV